MNDEKKRTKSYFNLPSVEAEMSDLTYKANVLCINCCYRNRLIIRKGELVADQVCHNCGVEFKRMIE